MARSTAQGDRSTPGSARSAEARRLIAGLRVSRHDEALLAVVRPYLADVASEGELAYRLWRRGLEVSLAEAVGLGATPPPGVTEGLIAGLAAQRLLLCAPLLRRTGTLALLGIAASPPSVEGTMAPLPPVTVPDPATVGQGAIETIDESAADAITSLGGSDFL